MIVCALPAALLGVAVMVIFAMPVFALCAPPPQPGSAAKDAKSKTALASCGSLPGNLLRLAAIIKNEKHARVNSAAKGAIDAVNFLRDAVAVPVRLTTSVDSAVWPLASVMVPGAKRTLTFSGRPEAAKLMLPLKAALAVRSRVVEASCPGPSDRVAAALVKVNAGDTDATVTLTAPDLALGLKFPSPE